MVNPNDQDEVAAIYHALRLRTVDLLRSCTPAQGELPVPSCPAWRVRDLASHVVGVVEDIVAGNMAGAASDPWTEAQVERHRGDRLEDLATILAANGATYDATVAMIPQPMQLVFMMDQITHEQDLRAAVGVPSVRDDDVAIVGSAYLWSVVEDRAPALAAAITALELSPFERLRVITGRRSASQLTALGVPVDALVAVLERTPMRVAAEDVADA